MKKLSSILIIILSLTMLASCGKEEKKKDKGQISVSGVFYPQQQTVQLNGYQTDQIINQYVVGEFQRQAQQNMHISQKAMSGQINITLVGRLNHHGQFNQYNQPMGYNPMMQQQYNQWGGNTQFNQFQPGGMGGQIQPIGVHFH